MTMTMTMTIIYIDIFVNLVSVRSQQSLIQGFDLTDNVTDNVTDIDCMIHNCTAH